MLHGMQRVPPHVYFVGSAVFHYLGPAFAVLLFARVDALGVAWLRIASAALVLAVPGVYLLTGIRLEGEPLGVALAFANAALFALYIVLAHRAAQDEGVDALG